MSEPSKPYNLLMAFFEQYGAGIDITSFTARFGDHGDGWYTAYSIKCGYDTYEWSEQKNRWWKSGLYSEFE